MYVHLNCISHEICAPGLLDMYMPHQRRSWVHPEGHPVWTFAILTFVNAAEAQKIDVGDSTFHITPWNIRVNVCVPNVYSTYEFLKLLCRELQIICHTWVTNFIRDVITQIWYIAYVGMLLNLFWRTALNEGIHDMINPSWLVCEGTALKSSTGKPMHGIQVLPTGYFGPRPSQAPAQHVPIHAKPAPKPSPTPKVIQPWTDS